MTKKDWMYTIGLFALAFLSRFIPHYPNFTAVGAIAVTGAMIYKRWEPALLATVLSLFISDLLINNVVMKEYYDGFVWFTSGASFIYIPFLLSVLLSRLLRSKGSLVSGWLLASTISSIIFFLVSNYGVWLGSQLYPQDLSGLLACYTAAIPFAFSQFTSTLVYGALILWAYTMAEKRMTETV